MTSTVARAPAWTLWSSIAAAGLGFFTMVIGFLASAGGPIIFGATLLAASGLWFLFSQAFYAPRNEAVEQPEPEPKTVAVQGPAPRQENFDHLLGHTLERVRPVREGNPEEWTPVPPGVAYLQMREEGNPLPEPEVMHRVRRRVATLPSLPRPVAVAREPLAGPDLEAPVHVGPRGRAEAVAATFTQPRIVHRLMPVVPAAKRRGEWAARTPTASAILGATQNVTGPTRPGRTRGRCGGCGTALWAPAYRPIRLRCPKCQKSAWLQ